MEHAKKSLELLQRKEGFTLNEVLVSVSLIAIGVLGFSLATVGVMRGNYLSRNVTIATSLAQDKMEELKAQTNPPNVDHCTAHTGETSINAVGAAGGIFDRCWRIGESLLGSDLKQIDVTVTWRDDVIRSVTLSTLVFTD